MQRLQDGQWRPLTGPASSGERALGLTVPLFAAASSHYESADPLAPRLVLLDEAFAGIDDEARASCMALIRQFDLDFVMTSEREWADLERMVHETPHSSRSSGGCSDFIGLEGPGRLVTFQFMEEFQCPLTKICKTCT